MFVIRYHFCTIATPKLIILTILELSIKPRNDINILLITISNKNVSDDAKEVDGVV